MVQSRYVSDLSIDEKVLMGIVRAAEGFKRTHSTIFRKYGLSFPQYNVLRVLEASENGRNYIRGVSKIMLVPQANMTGIAKRMEREGFLLRTSDPHDERVTVLEITPKGQKTLKKIEKEKDKSLAKILEDLSEDDKLELLAKVKKIIKKNR